MVTRTLQRLVLLGILLLALPSIALTQDFPNNGIPFNKDNSNLQITKEDTSKVKEVPQLTELQKLKAENLKLKVALAQTQATLQDRENRLTSFELSSEQTKLVEEYKKQLGAKENEVFDWEKLSFTSSPSTSK